jgi:hypothetical protein
MTDKALVEIRDTAGKWFPDCENPLPISPSAADNRVADLRASGIKARARLIEAAA